MNMAEAKSLEDRIEAIGHLAREGGAGARHAGGLSPKTALEAIAPLAASSLTEEPVETFRWRLDYRKALLRRPGERRLRYSRVVLERILRDRLAANGPP